MIVSFFADAIPVNHHSKRIEMENTTSNEAHGKGTLQYLVREPQVKTAANKAIILLHGVGSNEQDLFSLEGQLPSDYYIIAPRGQFTLAPDRYAWYNVDFSTGKPLYNKEQEASSREVISTIIEQVKEEYALDEIYLGGFSQGAIMSYTTGLSHPGKVTGVIALSGRLLDEIKPVLSKDEYPQKLRVFVAHGTHDGTLPVAYAREAKAYLETLEVQLSYKEYNIGHQINSEVIDDLNDWLKKAS
ncbi:MAG: serine esterase [Sphingobacteriaceae bacterium]|jgi:phospholipase/carboxylesterase|nr:serine esterase [Sphingobacteriaceae bacterium]